LPSDAFTENAITNVDAVSDVLSSVLVKSGVKGSDVAIAISSSHAITKVLSMPADLKDSDLEEQINIEALHFIPYPIDEVNLDYEVMGKSANSDEENDVLLVACRRTIVDNYIDSVESAGLELKYVDIDTYALERVYR